MFWNENMIYRCFSQWYEENMFLIMQKLQIDWLSQPFLRLGLRIIRDIIFDEVHLQPFHFYQWDGVTNLINANYILRLIQSCHYDKCYALKLSTPVP